MLNSSILPVTKKNGYRSAPAFGISAIVFAVYPNHIFVLLLKAGLCASFEK